MRQAAFDFLHKVKTSSIWKAHKSYEDNSLHIFLNFRFIELISNVFLYATDYKLRRTKKQRLIFGSQFF